MEQTDSDGQSILQLRKILRATRQEVFEAWTTPEFVKQWMCPGPQDAVIYVKLDLRIGGLFRVDMRLAMGNVVHTGVYREIVSPEKLVFTWRSLGTRDQDTLVTVELLEHEGGTELILTQTQLPDKESTGWQTDGWRGILTQLGHYLEQNGQKEPLQ